MGITEVRRLGTLLAILMLGVGLLALTAGTARGAETLTVTKTGDGGGQISSDPAGINCPGTCVAEFSAGSSVTLNVLPTLRSTFSGWSGACEGTAFSCVVTMDAAKAVGADFRSIAPEPITGISKPRVRPTPVKRKPGHKGRFLVTVMNEGDTVVGPVKVCAEAPARLLHLDRRCRALDEMAYGDGGTLLFGFRVRHRATSGREIKVRFTASTTGVESTHGLGVVKVK